MLRKLGCFIFVSSLKIVSSLICLHRYYFHHVLHYSQFFHFFCLEFCILLLTILLPLHCRYFTSWELKDQKHQIQANIFVIFITEYILRMQLLGPVPWVHWQNLVLQLMRWRCYLIFFAMVFSKCFIIFLGICGTNLFIVSAPHICSAKAMSFWQWWWGEFLNLVLMFYVSYEAWNVLVVWVFCTSCCSYL